MNSTDREQFWERVDTGNDPLLSALHSLVERWGMPAIVMCLGDIAKVLSEDAEDAQLTPNQRGLIIGCCAQVNALSDQMRAEMAFLQQQD